MGSLLALAAGMRSLGLLITLLAVSPQAATDQKPVAEGTIITSAYVTGFDVNRLSPGLREEISKLEGTPLNQQRLDELAARLEAERPRYVAAVRSVLDPDGRARVFFVMGRRDQPDRDDNINTRYVVEGADVTGVRDDELTQVLRDALAALVGKRLDSPEASQLQEQIDRDLPNYEVSRRIRRGSQPGTIRLVYEAQRRELPPWLRFEPLKTNVVYHSDQGWGSFLSLNMGNRTVRFTPIFAIDSEDDFVESNSGYGLRFESTKLGTRRLGASIEWTWFEQDWRTATLDAIALRPDIPSLYENRTTVTPLVKFAVTPELSLSAGVSISELEPQELAPVAESRMANAVVASIQYDTKWDDDEATHRAGGSFGVRAGSRELQSDLAYTRYFGEGWYRYDFGRHHVLASGLVGGITGNPPLFERFTLGDAATLRGWDKYDIAPVGGDRVVYSSVEYRYTGLALFLDVGSVWDAGTERKVRVSTGFGLHAGPAFITVGFPLNTDNLRAVFTMGLRVSGIGIRW
jgi:hypothetical protein